MTGTGARAAATVATDRHEWIAVGVVRGAFGVHGALKVEPYSDLETTVLNRICSWRIGMLSQKARPSVRAGQQPPFTLPAEVAVTALRAHGGYLVATIEPAVSREQALALKGAEVQVRRNDFPAPDPDEYYWADLIGCVVTDPSGGALGTVEALDDHGAHSILRLDNGTLIPFVAAVVLEVVPREKRIVADWSADWT